MLHARKARRSTHSTVCALELHRDGATMSPRNPPPTNQPQPLPDLLNAFARKDPSAIKRPLDEPIGCLVPTESPRPDDAARLAAYEAIRGHVRQSPPDALMLSRFDALLCGARYYLMPNGDKP
jgi:hypothetical protein